ncbi:MAG: ABC transporter permease subunit [Lachnospiraceae bacterium]|nr:ABC transporter permease subunit [Lachnospiraceae bacterium]
MSRTKTMPQSGGRSLKRRLADNWQLYAMLLVPVVLTIVYKYIPMYGIQIAFRDYKASRGFTGSEWIGLEWFRRFFSAPTFGRMMKNTILLSLYSLLWGFPIPIILALMMNQMRFHRFKRVTQTVLYAPHFISTMVICGMIRIFLSPSGGMVPTYLVVKQTGLINSMWALFLPGGVSVGNMIIVRNFFENSIPKEMIEAANIDGASKWTTFIKIVVPLSRSIMAVMVVFSMVAYWNDWFTSMIYLPSPNKAPLPLVLRNILIKSSASASQASTISGGFAELNKMTEMIKFSSIIIAALPMLIIYPFVQKYFEKGFMAGAVKG